MNSHVSHVIFFVSSLFEMKKEKTVYSLDKKLNNNWKKKETNAELIILFT